ncbi:hypothetical protein C1645_826134 [Glomus cerebriforme]|uniref:Uncharacterized protein n=1 Tax=Glomus cerebriforme TaxID=658196 RepID=A0A397SUG3_9GLOM|nr:hypothetical protein C1645_826134 [Glomus cerebriforme]
MAQQIQVPASQTVEPVRQLRDPLFSLKIEKCLKNYYVAEYLKESYFMPYKPIVPQCMPPDSDDDDNNSSDYDKENNKWYDTLGNSKYITDLLGWYTDMPVTLKDKENKMVIVIRNFVRIDNGSSSQESTKRESEIIM